MPLLIRKIEKSKWLQNDIFNGKEASADAVTGSLKTTGNTLSLWKINNEDDIEQAVLALVSGAQHLDTIDIIRIDQEEIENANLDLSNTPGLTPYKAYITSHFDIENLNYRTLGEVVNIVIKCLKNNLDLRFTRSKLKEILKNGIQQGLINFEDLNENIQDKIK